MYDVHLRCSLIVVTLCVCDVSSGEVVTFRGWPPLTWFVTENLSKSSRDWIPPPRATDDDSAYVEYTTAARDGSVMGVMNTRASMLGHVRTLTVACNYTEGTCASVSLDFHGRGRDRLDYIGKCSCSAEHIAVYDDCRRSDGVCARLQERRRSLARYFSCKSALHQSIVLCVTTLDIQVNTIKVYLVMY